MICAAIVTFNRKELLLKTLESLLQQTRPLDKIFLINNASTDGTEDLLRAKGLLDHPLISYRRMDENEGGAGGFHEAIKWAYESGAEWIWTLDDDVLASPVTLETLLKYKDVSKCIHPAKKYENGERFIWEGYFDSTTGRSIWVNDGFIKTKEFSVVNYACFEGMLVHRDIVAKIGFPDKRFFICHDDLIYGFLASFHTNIIYLHEILLTRLIPETTKKNPRALFSYYAIRNLFLMYEYLLKFSPRFNPLVCALFFIAKGFKILFSNFNLFQVKLALRAVRDGAAGKYYRIEM